ncbi:uncharacterized protein LOC107810239 [Nicotiana tabacum]|uniref:Uncharacterized protein LOC107810239 n=2 Tax=Nicotiana TaxID=4085 RepID=A0A1S4BNN4_TOBAC|nr:PREDICTED: uncharacterized protein LOC104249409 [Nicotiana sylvestris]XP_016490482.1 PREDICTED: uncharacterized protein LOC107810239 [Nicotiana tabacum]
MENYYTLKMARKDFEYVYDDFNDFSLSSPATKIRRLDVELQPIVEEVEEEPMPIAFEQVATNQSFGINGGDLGRNGPVIEELPSVPENEERAIVLFKPMNTQLVQSPSDFSIKVNPQFTNGFKNPVLWGSQSCILRRAGDENADENLSGSSKGCLAVVPWVPSQLPSAQGDEFLRQADVLEMMEAEDMDGVTMDVEDNSVSAGQRTAIDAGLVGVNERLHQWQQQHCMIPPPPHSTSTPIVWYR